MKRNISKEGTEQLRSVGYSRAGRESTDSAKRREEDREGKEGWEKHIVGVKEIQENQLSIKQGLNWSLPFTVGQGASCKLKRTEEL